ncbi:MAG: serine/threonine-protein phosphatase [Lachnospiraceae bacterium]|nr:serine/threonine-protein phosphatase [Lachnospiraceae bacterium]
MRFLAGAATHIGTTKNTNQDSLTIKLGRCGNKNIAMAVLCDGMGGLQRGEVASGLTVRKFSEWLEGYLPAIIKEEKEGMVFDKIQSQWNMLLEEINHKLNNYGKENRVNVGTTITAILIIDDEYVIANVGDSRTYLLGENISQITEDQSLIAREIKCGRLTEEQAKTDPRRNVLFQCIGATPNLEIEYYRGKVCEGDGVLLCSDGFRHMVSSDELFVWMNPKHTDSEEIIENKLSQLIRINMDRGETDNITAAYIKVSQE